MNKNERYSLPKILEIWRHYIIDQKYNKKNNKLTLSLLKNARTDTNTHPCFYRELISKPNHFFYLKLLFFASIIILPILIIVANNVTDPTTIISTIIGIYGSYVASVAVSWFIDINTCRRNTIDRLRSQNDYMEKLVEWCARFYHLQIKGLHPNCKRHTIMSMCKTLRNDYIDKIDREVLGIPEEEKQLLIKQACEKLFTPVFTDVHLDYFSHLIEHYEEDIQYAVFSNTITHFDMIIIRRFFNELELLNAHYDKHDWYSLWETNKEILKTIDTLSQNCYPFYVLRVE